SGVVLIDEIDSHLHPKWQREAGSLLTTAFPNIQFIVTSHSPFVAMAAGDGAITLLQKDADVVRVNQDLPSIRGWAVDQVLSYVFGLPSLRDPEITKELEEYEELRLGSRNESLSTEGQERLHVLETELNGAMQGDDDAPASRELREDLNYFSTMLKERLRQA
nr:AAA family ATPase [Armatimonadota bacterium]